MLFIQYPNGSSEYRSIAVDSVSVFVSGVRVEMAKPTTRGEQVRLGFTGPREIRVMRTEIDSGAPCSGEERLQDGNQGES